TWREGWGWGFGGFFLMVLMMALFWGALIGTAIWAIRQFRPPRLEDDASPTGRAAPGARIRRRGGSPTG
ncbi:MAG: hypothetical protein ACM3WR_12545, partial [Solirubrobacterales bacterium]